MDTTPPHDHFVMLIELQSIIEDSLSNAPGIVSSLKDTAPTLEDAFHYTDDGLRGIL